MLRRRFAVFHEKWSEMVGLFQKQELELYERIREVFIARWLRELFIVGFRSTHDIEDVIYFLDNTVRQRIG